MSKIYLNLKDHAHFFFRKLIETVKEIEKSQISRTYGGIKKTNI